MAVRKKTLIFVAMALAFLVGCGTEPTNPPPAPVGLPINDTPENAVLRLVAAFEQKKYAEYVGMFTGDYTYVFASIDPNLQQKWAAGWFKADEDSFAKHLFYGGRNMAGEMLPPAQSIEVTLRRTLPGNDTEGRDSTRYKVLATTADGTIIVPNPGNPSDPTTYLIVDVLLRLWLARGNVAVGLAPGQPADSTRWYVWKWEDGSPLVFGAATAHGPTWGWLRGLYR